MEEDFQYLRELNDALRHAFRSYKELKMLLRYEFNKQWDDITPADKYKFMVHEVLEEAEAEGWLNQLVLAALRQKPGNPKLRNFAQRFGLAPTAQVMVSPEAIIQHSSNFIDVHIWQRRLAEREYQICHITTSQTQGTGFLVGPDLILTNYHVIHPHGKERCALEEVRVSFDHKIYASGETSHPRYCKLASKDALLDWSPMSLKDTLPYSPFNVPTHNELDYALLRLNESPGLDPISGKGQRNVRYRNWISLSHDPYPFQQEPFLLILQHPHGQPLKMALNSFAFKDINQNRTRICYQTSTDFGSSGAPCLNSKLDVIALHQAGNEQNQYNIGIPTSTIYERLEKQDIHKILQPPINTKY